MAERYTTRKVFNTDGELVLEEQVDRGAEVYNLDLIVERAISALASNLEYVAIETPTNAQAAAQIKALTRQVNGIIRYMLNRFDSAD